MRYLTAEEARVKFPNAIIGDRVIIWNSAYIGDRATIWNGVVIGERATIGERVHIGGGTTIGDGAHIGNGATIGNGARIARWRKNITRCMTIAGCNNWGLTAHDSSEGLIIVIGCMNDYQGLRPDEALELTIAKYGYDHIYTSMIMLAEEWYAKGGE